MLGPVGPVRPAASVVDAIVEDSALREVGETEEFHRIRFPSRQVHARNQFPRHPFKRNASVNPFSGAITGSFDEGNNDEDI